MNKKKLSDTIIIATAAIGVFFLLWWMTYDPASSFAEHHPGEDNRPEMASIGSTSIDIGGYFEVFAGSTVLRSASWPRFRGEYFDNISRAEVKLTDGWGKDGPPILWTAELGEGHAGPVISNGRVYLLDYDEENRRDILRCFSFNNGKEIWRRGYALDIKRNHGMSRTVPAVSGNYALTIGPKCQVMCVSADSGKFRWGIDLSKDYAAEVPLWYTGQCPLIDDAVAVLAVGGSVLMIGVDCRTGEVLWETPNPMNWKMSHSSVIPMTIGNMKMYIYCAIGGIVGISADTATRGQLLFQSSEWNHAVIAPSPVYLGNGKIYLTAGYGAGSMVVRVSKMNGSFQLEVLQKLSPEQGLAAEQQTPVFYKNYLYSIMPKDAGALRNQFICVNPEDAAKTVWSSGKTKRFGLGPFLMADDKFFILSDEGVLTVIEASRTSYRQLAEAKILNGHDAWGPLAIADGHLLARDSRKMVCVDVRVN
jgi:outer membrane protein assembly factor BamB